MLASGAFVHFLVAEACYELIHHVLAPRFIRRWRVSKRGRRPRPIPATRTQEPYYIPGPRRSVRLLRPRQALGSHSLGSRGSDDSAERRWWRS